MNNDYRRDGYLIARGLFSRDEISVLSAEANRVLARQDLIDFNNLLCRWLNHFQTEECRFACFDPIIDLSDSIDREARDTRLFDLISSLYGEEICLFKDTLIDKPPGAMDYGMQEIGGSSPLS